MKISHWCGRLRRESPVSRRRTANLIFSWLSIVTNFLQTPIVYQLFHWTATFVVLELFISSRAHIKANGVLMDSVATDLVLCSCVFGCVRLAWRWGVLLRVREEQVSQGPPRIPLHPHRGGPRAWNFTGPRRCERTARPPAKQPDAQMVAANSASIF